MQEEIASLPAAERVGDASLSASVETEGSFLSPTVKFISFSTAAAAIASDSLAMADLAALPVLQDDLLKGAYAAGRPDPQWQRGERSQS